RGSFFPMIPPSSADEGEWEPHDVTDFTDDRNAAHDDIGRGVAAPIRGPAGSGEFRDLGAALPARDLQLLAAVHGRRFVGRGRVSTDLFARLPARASIRPSAAVSA